MRRLSRKNLFLSVLLFLTALCPAAVIKAQNSENGAGTPKAVPLPSTQYVRSHDYDTQNVVLNLRFDWKTEQALGTATITFSPLVSNLKTVQLDAANMTISAVTLVSGAPLVFANDVERQKLSITLDKAYQPGDIQSVIITYHTNGTAETRSINGGGGLSFIQPTQSEPGRPRQIWSQGESIYSHYWFPCFDNPNDFFTSEIIATVEKPLMVISNGRLISTTENPDGTRTFDWKIEQPHASYLTSIVVGEYVPVGGSYQGVPVNTYVYPNEVEAGRVTTSRLPDMVRFFSEKTGIKYPYAKYAQTVARDFSGGMENISATTQTDQIIHDARQELDQSSDSIQSHELAHQWFGDYVTCRSWADLWLNESFATYFQALWDEHHLGENDFLYLDVGNNQKEYLENWDRGIRRPIVTENYANPDAVFDVYDYQRGGAVLHMLRKSLGEENWWRAIHYYLTKYAHQPVQTEQFRIAIEEATGQSMDRFFDQWLYRMGHPVFNVVQQYDPTAKKLTLNVRQDQKLDPSSSFPQVQYFETPVEVEIGTANATRVERIMIEPKLEQSFTFAVDSEPLIVNFDYKSTIIKELHFAKTTQALIYQLTHDQDMMGRLWALGRLKERLDDNTVAESDKKLISATLAQSLSSDKFWGVRVNLARSLAGVPGHDVRAALIAASKDSDSHVRAAAVSSLASFKDAVLSKLFRSMLNDPSYAVVRSAAFALGSQKDSAAFESLVKLADEPSWHGTSTVSALRGLIQLEDKRALAVAFKYVVNPEPAVKSQALVLLGTVGKGDARSFEVIARAFRESFETQNTMIGTGAAEALAELGDPRGLEVLAQARKSFANPEVAQLISLQLERLQKLTSDNRLARHDR
jgi:aminopeptidase N